MAVTEIATLDVVKSYLQIPSTDTTYDTTISTILMPAAQGVIEREIGRVVATPVRAERHSGGHIELWLRETPVLYVQSVEEGWGYYNWELDPQTVNSQPAYNIWSYSVDRPEEGLITRRGPGNVAYPFVCGKDNIRVDYVAGRHEVPNNALLAYCELVSIWFRQSQLRMRSMTAGSETQFNALGEDYSRTTGEETMNYGVPEIIIEMLKPNRKRPVIG